MKLTGAPRPTSRTQKIASIAPAIAKIGLGLSNWSFISCADGISTDAIAAATNSAGFSITPPKPFEPDSDRRRDIAVLKLSDRNRTQPTRTNVIVSNHPKPFGNGLFNDCHPRQVISPTPCQSPQNTKVHPAPCQSPQIAMLPKVAAM